METHKKLVNRAFETLSPNDFKSIQNKGALTRSKLVDMRAKAIRRGIWYRVLTRAERAYIELTIKVINVVRSHFLAKVLTSVIRKLLNAMESKVACFMREAGHPLAQKISRIAQSWGNMSGSQWMKDRCFIRYLAVMYINTPAMFKLNRESLR
jgi:hypothetical protein